MGVVEVNTLVDGGREQQGSSIAKPKQRFCTCVGCGRFTKAGKQGVHLPCSHRIPISSLSATWDSGGVCNNLISCAV